MQERMGKNMERSISNRVCIVNKIYCDGRNSAEYYDKLGNVAISKD